MERALARLAFLTVGAILALALGGCTLKHPVANVVKGKQLFAAHCATCHTLAHASSTGTVGPNLDDAFRQDRIDGEKSSAIQGFVDYWIQYPNSQGVMPAKLVKGQDAQDVAAYVAKVASIPGVDTGALATAVQVNVPVTAAEGKTIFTGVGGCGGCHVLADAGTTGQTGPNLTTHLASDCANPASKAKRGTSLAQCITTAILHPYLYLPAGYAAGIMPANFGQQLSATQIKALVTYLVSVTH